MSAASLCLSINPLPESDSLQAYQLGESSGRNGCSFVGCAWRYEEGAAAGVYSIQYTVFNKKPFYKPTLFLVFLCIPVSLSKAMQSCIYDCCHSSTFLLLTLISYSGREMSYSLCCSHVLLLYVQALPEAHTPFYLSFHEHLHICILLHLHSLLCNFFFVSSRLLRVLTFIQFISLS